MKMMSMTAMMMTIMLTVMRMAIRTILMMMVIMIMLMNASIMTIMLTVMIIRIRTILIMMIITWPHLAQANLTLQSPLIFSLPNILNNILTRPCPYIPAAKYSHVQLDPALMHSSRESTSSHYRPHLGIGAMI